MGYHGNIHLKFSEGEGGVGGEEETNPNYLAVSAGIISRWLVVAWWHVAACAYLSNVSALPTWWVYTAKYWGVVGQSKMSCAATGKRNKSKVNPGLG